MVVGSVFAVTLLCAIVPCEVNFDPPQVSIKSKYFTGPSRDTLRNEYPVVFTSSGGLRGYSMATIQGNRIHAFEGIRYGQSPTGNLRFRPPLPAASWTGIRPAFKPGPRCIQFHPGHVFQVIGREDCLFLNIYSPNIPDPQKDMKPLTRIPVVVWFHGGSFAFGAGHEYGPAYITDRNIILVTVNYRLGVYGFMSTGDEASPGNYGLKDQVLALKWIHENIANFGGDPDKVTLLGQSAGGVSAHLHMLSHRSREYFRSAVSLSSSGFHNWGVQTPCQAKYWTNRLADVAKCPRTTQGTQALVDCFRRQNPAFLVAYTTRIFRWFLFPPVLFAPTVEVNHPDAFLNDTVANHYVRGDVARKPWISGLTSGEGYLLVYLLNFFVRMKYFRSHFSEYQAAAYDYGHVVNASSLDDISTKIRNFYFGSESPITVPEPKIAQILTDRYFSNAQVTAIKAHRQIAPTYSYFFDFKGRTNLGRLVGAIEPEWGVGHGEDVFYYLNASTYYDGMVKNTPDYKLSQTILNFLGNFVRKSVPYYTESNGTKEKYWEIQKPTGELRLMYFGNTVKMIDNPLTERVKFWETLGIPDVTPFIQKEIIC